MPIVMPSKPLLRSSPFSSPFSFFSSFFSSGTLLLNSSALALFRFASSSSLSAASSRRLASASYSEKHISPDFNIELDQGGKLTTPVMVFIAAFFSFLPSFFFLAIRMARGASGAGRLWGPAPKPWVPAPRFMLLMI